MPVKVPGVTGPVDTRSAPCTSLVRTLPVRVSKVSDAVPALLSSTAFGKSSTMFTSSVALAVVPLSSTTVTANCSGRLFAPLAVGWASLSTRV
ncbi:hypothetical protein D3C81_1497760 [compost metagenome]